MPTQASTAPCIAATLVAARADTHRLIPETYTDTTEPFLAALADNSADVEALTKIAARTSGRTLAQNGQLPGGPGPHDLVFDVPYSKIINGAFSYPGNKGGRFNTNTWGAWYAGKSLKTALAEVTFHRSVLLTETAAIDDEIEYVDFLADIRGSQFADLRDGSRKSRRCLDPASHVQGQTLAHELLADKLAGLCIRRFVIPAASALRCYVRRWSAMCARGLAIGLCGQTVRQCA